MKQFLPVALSLLIVACAPPKPGTDAHQRQLVEEARVNFYALKEQERIARGGAPLAREDARNQQQQRPAKVRLKPFATAPKNDTVYESSKPAPVAKVKPAATPAPKLAAVSKPAPVATAPKPTSKPVANKPAPAPKKFSWFASSTPKPAAQQKAAPKTNTKVAQKPAAKPTPKPAPKLFAKAAPAAKPTPAPKTKAATVRTKTKPTGDTVYIYDLPKTQEPNTRRYRSYKAKYAASLNKKPENLSRKELEWVRNHYRE